MGMHHIKGLKLFLLHINYSVCIFSVDHSETGGKYNPVEHVMESNSIQAKSYMPVTVPGNEEENRPKQSENVAIANACLPDSTQQGFFQTHNIVMDTHGSGVLPKRLNKGVQLVEEFTESPREFLPPTVYSTDGSFYENIPHISSGNDCCNVASPIARHQQPVLPAHGNLTTSDASPKTNSTILCHCEGICLSSANFCDLKTNYPPSPEYMPSTSQAPLSVKQSTSKVLPLEQVDDLFDDIDLKLLESLTPTTSAPFHIGTPLTCEASQDVTTNTSYSYHHPTPNTTLLPPTDRLDDIHSTFTPEQHLVNPISNGTQIQSNHSSSLPFNPFESSIDQVIDKLLVETSSDDSFYPDLSVHDQSYK